MIVLYVVLVLLLALGLSVFRQSRLDRHVRDLQQSLQAAIDSDLVVNKSKYSDVVEFLHRHPELSTTAELFKKYPEDRRPGTYFVMAAVDKDFRSHFGLMNSDIGVEFYFDEGKTFIGAKVERRYSGP